MEIGIYEKTVLEFFFNINKEQDIFQNMIKSLHSESSIKFIYRQAIFYAFICEGPDGFDGYTKYQIDNYCSALRKSYKWRFINQMPDIIEEICKEVVEQAYQLRR